MVLNQLYSSYLVSSTKKTVDYDHVKANVYFDIKSHGLDVT